MQIELVAQHDAIARWQELVDDPELAKIPNRIEEFYTPAAAAASQLCPLFPGQL